MLVIKVVDTADKRLVMVIKLDMLRANKEEETKVVEIL